jgi:DNA (cytosine-5)-methyltransferase 1
MSGLVLSLFPGIGLLDMAFEEEGFCVVRGPDLLWGGDVRRFHPPSGRFDGVIGGPPCKGESSLAHLNGTPGQSLADEFRRVVREARPSWWVMEAVVAHDDAPYVACLNNRWVGGTQNRRRWFHSNLPLHRCLETEAFEPLEWDYAVLAGHGGAVGSVQRGMAKYSLEDACELQGLPRDFTASMPFTKQWKHEVIGNGVPLAMGRAIAKAVRKALA